MTYRITSLLSHHIKFGTVAEMQKLQYVGSLTFGIIIFQHGEKDLMWHKKSQVAGHSYLLFPLELLFSFFPTSNKNISNIAGATQRLIGIIENFSSYVPEYYAEVFR
ncbi:hypothetical protein OCU04_009035 [Sclerotinia nivalis]|uniref:Uncharacterized protein n=1 Tax=Sclerotinia nivalis TaxID=352851 RepID=A0A9X0DHB7_9HELO|nr:hypothetical protein OCU04_009035 [Sclerotinia nivalis]